MEKPKYNSPIKDKIKWLEWFIANTTEEERLLMTTKTEREHKSNDGRTNNGGRPKMFTDEEQKAKKLQANKEWYAKKRLERQEELKALGKEIKRGRQAVLTEEEKLERQRQRCRERYYKSRGLPIPEPKAKLTDEEKRERNRLAQLKYRLKHGMNKSKNPI